MLTALQPDLPTIEPQVSGATLAERVASLEQAWRDDRRRLLEAMRGMWDTLNQDGALGDVTPWTPSITFATAGDLNVGYATRIGQIAQFGPHWLIMFDIVTNAFTHTTASGNLSITGNPAINRSLAQAAGTMSWQGITKANYTEMKPVIVAGASAIGVVAAGSGQAGSFVGTGDMPTGGTVALRGNILLLS